RLGRRSRVVDHRQTPRGRRAVGSGALGGINGEADDGGVGLWRSLGKAVGQRAGSSGGGVERSARAEQQRKESVAKHVSTLGWDQRRARAHREYWKICAANSRGCDCSTEQRRAR